MKFIGLIVVLFFSPLVQASGEYQAPEAFVSEAFAQKPPTPQVLWVTESLAAQIKTILGHALAAGRIRYWQQGQRSVWVLEEIGKEQPITVGVIVNQDKIEILKVLIFRESRGWEVRSPAFTRQYQEAGLRADLSLNKNIDGITGATLSVRALNKIARLALFLHAEIHKP